jgi:hypothetical protein
VGEREGERANNVRESYVDGTSPSLNTHPPNQPKEGKRVVTSTQILMHIWMNRKSLGSKVEEIKEDE